MTQIKMFTSISLSCLEQDVNNFLMNNDYIFVDLIWTTDGEYSCCLVYKITKQRKPYEKF